MGENTKIQWAHHTFNPWRGCTKVAPGCANCYADAQSKRNPKTLGIWGPNGTRVVAAESTWKEPIKWNRDGCPQCKGQGVVPDWIGSVESDLEQSAKDCPTCEGREFRPRVFCASLADVFEDWQGPIKNAGGYPMHHAAEWGMPDAWTPIPNTFVGKSLLTLDDARARLFRLIDATPDLDWLLLTKRPENIRRMVHDSWTEKAPGHVSQNDGDGRRWKRRDNVWLGTSIACQEDADRNIPELLKCRDLAAKLFLSIEPLVGPVDLSKWLGLLTYSPTAVIRTMPNGMTYPHPSAGQTVKEYASLVDWVIVGGESGPNARPCNVAWVRSLVRQCKDAGVPVFVKQLGSRASEYVVTAVGQDAYGNVDDDGRWEALKLRDPKGGDPAEWPEDLRVREVPHA